MSRTTVSSRSNRTSGVASTTRTTYSRSWGTGIVTRTGNKFTLNGKRFRFVGVNKYTLNVSTLSQASVQAFFDACQTRGINVVRTWCFDAGNPPSNSGGNFRYLYYTPGSNLISNSGVETNSTGWTLGTDATRSNADAHGGTWSLKNASTSGYSRISTPVTVSASTDYVLTFWTKVTNSSGAAPVIFIGSTAGNNDVKDGGFNTDTSGEWIERQVLFNSGANTTIYVAFQNWNGNATAYYDDINVSVQGTATLTAREASFAQLDMVLDEARQRGVKLILSLADNPTYFTKLTYVNWANTINSAGLSTSFPYIGFFSSDYCKSMYKDFVDILTSRVNTINGRTYKNDDSIFAWELGNELRLDRDDPSNGNSLSSANLALMNGWIGEMATYIKSQDPNHLVAFSSGSHGYQYATGDTVWNGTYYGVDYGLISAITDIDYVSCHFYPTQGGGEVEVSKKHGQKLGYPDTINTAGLVAQLQDYVSVIKANGKPFVMGETGFIREVIGSNTIIPLYPRVNTFSYIFNIIFGADGDGVILWHGEISDGGSYSINLLDWNNDTTNLNYNDTPVQSLIQGKNHSFNGRETA